jgi:hypothetical protein
MLTAADIMINLLVQDFIMSGINGDGCSLDTRSHTGDKIF